MISWVLLFPNCMTWKYFQSPFSRRTLRLGHSSVLCASSPSPSLFWKESKELQHDLDRPDNPETNVVYWDMIHC